MQVTFYGQAAVQIEIHETERGTVGGLDPWDKRVIQIPPAMAGSWPIEVTFDYSVEQILSVEVEIKAAGMKEKWISDLSKRLEQNHSNAKQKVEDFQDSSWEALGSFQDRVRKIVDSGSASPALIALTDQFHAAMGDMDLPKARDTRAQILERLFDEGLSLG